MEFLFVWRCAEILPETFQETVRNEFLPFRL